MGAQPLRDECQPVFAVDLDDSLLKTDLLLERIVNLAAHAPLNLLKIPLKLLGGKLSFKRWLSTETTLDYSTLPVRQEVLDRVKEARGRGEKTVLISASLNEDVLNIAQLYPFFDVSVGTSDINLKGSTKLKFLEETFPSAPITYVGDSLSDLDIWDKCQKIIAINPSPYLSWRIRSKSKLTEFIFDKSNNLKFLVRELRPYQWVKNVLVFLPVFAAHRFFDLGPWIAAAKTFLSFSFLASAVYVFNDLCDLSSDRRQKSKNHRPLASGNLSLKTAILLIPACLTLSVVFSWNLSPSVFHVLGCYLLMNILYSFWVKKILVMDVVFLAGFYSLRIFAGGFASEVSVSEWLLSFSVFFFFGLAMIKRFSEIKAQLLSASKTSRRAYDSQDLITIQTSGICTSVLSILILALYLSTGEVKKLYSHPQILWFVTPVLLFWINRIWILGSRGLVKEDPLVFALKDKVTWAVGLITAIIFLKAI